MATSGKKPSAIKVIRDRKTTALPPMQLGSFHRLLTPDEYEGKTRFKARFHINPEGITALAAILQAKCIDAHFPKMKEEVDEEVAEAKAAKKTPALTICDTKEGCKSPADWIEDALKEPREKDKVQLPTIQLAVDAYLPLKKDQDPSDREMRTIKFWNAKGVLLCDSSEPTKDIKQMAAGTWVKPVVHTNLFASKQLGKDPRPQLMLVGLQIIKLEKFGSGQVDSPDAADDEEMRRIMGDEYDPADDLHAMTAGDDHGSDDLDDESPF